MNRVVTFVSGTHGAKWAQPGAPFPALLERHGVTVLPSPEWSEDVVGASPFTIFAARKHSDWIAGGFGFNKTAEDLPYWDRVFLAHSYGGNVCAYGLARPDAVPIRRLITIATPDRADMVKVWEAARRKIGCHIHICDPDPPFLEALAQLFDGRVGCPRAGHPTADHVVLVEGMKHSRILNNDKGMVSEWENPRRLVRLIDWILLDEVPGERQPVGL